MAKIDLSDAESHKVFLVEAKGDTLIVSPTGEAFEFQQSLIASELETLKYILEEPDVRNLLIDLHRETYYGSVIIGLLNSLVNHALEWGKQAAICNASDEMQKVMKIMNLTERWPLYPTRKKALNALNS